MSDIQTAGYKTLTEIQALGYQTIASLTTAGYKTATATLTDVASVGYQTLATLASNGYKTAADTLVDVASAHYTKPEVNSLIPKGVRAEGSFEYVKNNSNVFSIAQANFFAASNVSWDSSLVLLTTRLFGNSAYWSYAPDCRQIIYKFPFTSPILDDAGEETSEYKVMLTKRDVALSYTNTIFDLAVYNKTPDYFEVRVEIEVDTSNYHIENHAFDFVVF